MKYLLAILFLSFTSAQAADVKDLLAKTIKDASGINNNLKVSLVKGQSMTANQDNLSVTKLDFDTKSGEFTAYISANGNLPVEVAGNFTETAKIPVLNRKFDKNEIINESDITYLEIETSKLRNSFITSVDQLIGKAPIRSILKERPISESQIAAAKVVTKNKQLAMMYKNNSLTIKTEGIALEDGAIGQSVRFKNANSNKIVRAKIVSAGLAEVQSTSELASN